jgi:ADP-ribosylglycohydrolase
MALCIAQVAASTDLASPAALDRVAERFLDWLRGGATDVGNLTRAVLGAAEDGKGPAAERCREAAMSHLGTHLGNTAGNGALMRSGVVGLVRLHDRQATAQAARAIAELTHADRLCGDSCVLWSEAVRLAVLEGRLELRSGLELLPEERQPRWRAAIDEADSLPAAHFVGNGFTVIALQAAWAAIRETASQSREAHMRAALEVAVHIGHDTDTVAAIAGALVGARWGASCVPAEWRRALRGWPGLDVDGLVRLGRDIAVAGATV